MEEKTITIEPAPLDEFVPPLVEGDAQFFGHGPDVDIHIKIEIKNTNQIWAHTYMKARETEEDYTTAEGTSDVMIFNGSLESPPILAIYDILSDSVSSWEYTDVNPVDDHKVNPSGTELIREFVVTGNTVGSEAGTKTGVSASFNPVTIRVLEGEIIEGRIR